MSRDYDFRLTMATEDNFIVRVDDPNAIYSPGYPVSGKVELHLNKEVKIKGMHFKIHIGKSLSINPL